MYAFAMVMYGVSGVIFEMLLKMTSTSVLPFWFQMYTMAAPWGFLPDTQIYQLVTRENERPDRPINTDSPYPMTDFEWTTIEAAWNAVPTARPTFTYIVAKISEYAQSGLTSSSHWARALNIQAD